MKDNRSDGDSNRDNLKANRNAKERLILLVQVVHELAGRRQPRTNRKQRVELMDERVENGNYKHSDCKVDNRGKDARPRLPEKNRLGHKSKCRDKLEGAEPKERRL